MIAALREAELDEQISWTRRHCGINE